MTPRVRTQGPGVVPLGSSTYTVEYCGNPSTTGTVVNSVGQGNGWTRMTTDFVIPGFHKRSARGEIFNNPYSSTYIEEVGTIGGTWVQTAKAACSSNPSQHKRTTLPGGFYTRAAPLIVETGMPDLRTLAGTQAMAGVESANVQGLVELAELSKTFRMLRNPLENVKRLLIQIKRSRKFKRWKMKRQAAGIAARSLADFLASEWLRYRYGFMPLLYLADDLLAASVEPGEPERKTSRGSSNFTVTDQNTSSGGNPVTETWVAEQYHQISYSCRAGVLYIHRLDLNANYGIRLSDIPEAAWELTPFSFVSDWFVNVGDFLGAIRPKLGVEVLASWTVMRVLNTYQKHVTCSGGTGDANYSYSSNRTAFSRKLERTTSRSPGVAVGLAVKWKPIEDWSSIHLKRCIDSVALINQLLHK